MHDFVRTFLESQGFSVEIKDGVDFVTAGKPGGDGADRVSFVYHPRFRSAEYLAKLVQPFFSGRVASQGAGLTSGGTQTLGPQAAVAASESAARESVAVASAVMRSDVSSADDLVFFGKPGEVAQLKKLLPELDDAPGEVVVRGWVYEVSNTDDRNSAFSIAAHVLDGRLGISNGSTGTDSNALTFDAHFLSLVISALSADQRFKEVSDPYGRVVSGGKMALSVGSQVPTLGAVSYQGSSGTPVQSVEYQAAGVIFEVQPIVLGSSIEVRLEEQISSFVPTTTGVNGSPTKNTRAMATTVRMRDGEVVVLGGLRQDLDAAASVHEGWLPRFLDGKSQSKGHTEVLLVLQVQHAGGSAG